MPVHTIPQIIKGPAIMCLVVAAAALGACNTIEGAGKDIEKAGQTIESKADENK